jgi:hypothetical protein
LSGAPSWSESRKKQPELLSGPAEEAALEIEDGLADPVITKRVDVRRRHLHRCRGVGVRQSSGVREPAVHGPSEADALDFKSDFAVDLKELWEAMKESSESVHKKVVTEMRVFAESQSELLKSVIQAKASEMELSSLELAGPVDEVGPTGS